MGLEQKFKVFLMFSDPHFNGFPTVSVVSKSVWAKIGEELAQNAQNPILTPSKRPFFTPAWPNLRMYTPFWRSCIRFSGFQESLGQIGWQNGQKFQKAHFAPSNGHFWTPRWIVVTQYGHFFTFKGLNGECPSLPTLLESNISKIGTPGAGSSVFYSNRREGRSILLLCRCT